MGFLLHSIYPKKSTIANPSVSLQFLFNNLYYSKGFEIFNRLSEKSRDMNGQSDIVRFPVSSTTNSIYLIILVGLEGIAGLSSSFRTWTIRQITRILVYFIEVYYIIQNTIFSYMYNKTVDIMEMYTS